MKKSFYIPGNTSFLKTLTIVYLLMFLLLKISLAEEKTKEVNVIIEEDLGEKRISNLNDFFIRYTGADITDYGQPGTNRQIGLLGLLDRHTLIRLDERPINANRKEKADLNAIPINLIQKIKIKKGLSSVLDGPNSFGGTIDLITREGMYSETPYSRLYSRWGTARLETYGFNFDNRNGSLQYFLFAEKNFSNGYWLNSKYNSKNINGKFDWYYSPDAWFTILLGEYTDKKGIPGIFYFYPDQNEENNKNKFAQLKYEAHFSGTDLKIRFYSDKDLMKFNDGTASFLYENNVQGKEAVIEQKIGEYHLIRLGGDHHWNKFNGDIRGGDEKRILSRDDALFFEDELKWENLLLTLGVRKDKNSFFEKEYNPRFGLNYAIDKSCMIFVSAGRGFQPVAFNDFYLPISLQKMGINQENYENNPDLLPEKGWVYMVGCEKDFSENLSIGVDTHWADVENSLILNYNYESAAFRPENIPELISQGLETHIRLRISRNFNMQTIYTYTKAFDNDTKKNLPYRPQDKLKTVFTYNKINHNGDLIWQVKFDNEYQSDSYTDRTNAGVLEGFIIYNLNIAMKLAKSFALDFAANNIFDNRYAYVNEYPMPSRNFWGGVTWEFWD